jgi:hypothetical protein
MNKTTDGSLRFYVHDGTTALSFEIAGRLSDDGADELQHAWRTASLVIGDRSLIVDLSYVTGIDVAGRRLVRRWHDRGAQLVARSPEARVLVQSITGQSAGELTAGARHSTWLPFQAATRIGNPSRFLGRSTAAGNVLATNEVYKVKAHQYE